jgi:hypothetical protein
MTLPSAEELGDFASSVQSASWGISNTGNTDVIEEWVKTSGWDFVTLQDHALVGTFELTGEPESDNFIIAGIFTEGEPKSYISYFGKELDQDLFDYRAKFASYIGSPEDVPDTTGLTDRYVPSQEVSSEGDFEDQSGGLQDEFGQIWDAESMTWKVWNWSQEGDEWTEGVYHAWVGQYHSQDNQYFVFTDILEVSGATALACSAVSAGYLFLV